MKEEMDFSFSSETRADSNMDSRNTSNAGSPISFKYASSPANNLSTPVCQPLNFLETPFKENPNEEEKDLEKCIPKDLLDLINDGVLFPAELFQLKKEPKNLFNNGGFSYQTMSFCPGFRYEDKSQKKNKPGIPSFFLDKKPKVKKPSKNSKKDTNKKEFVERKGDWSCIRCKNINFSFRNECNICHLKKSISDKEVENFLRRAYNYFDN